ncbi:MAG: DUF2062 domain-containing protein [Pseudomonadota bacterium]|nr:MAG: DUF2062 domain-containing protein [Pseudomonadota bacterium]
MFTRFLLRHRRATAAGEGPVGRSQRVRAWLNRSGCLRFRREPVARGVAVGLLIGMTPTVGFQTLLMLAGCLLIRGNFPAAFAVSWISNPLTLPAMVWAYHQLGERLFGRWLGALSGGGRLDEAFSDVVATALGSLIFAVPVALIGYLAVLGAAEVWQRRRHHARRRRRVSARRGKGFAQRLHARHVRRGQSTPPDRKAG